MCRTLSRRKERCAASLLRRPVVGEGDCPWLWSLLLQLLLVGRQEGHPATPHLSQRFCPLYEVMEGNRQAIYWLISNWLITVAYSYIVIAAAMLHDLVTLTLDLLTLVSGHTWRVTWPIHPPSLKILTAIRSWVISSDISHRISLTMRLQPLRMRRITRPMRRWAIFSPHIWNPLPRFPYSLYNFYGATIKTNGVVRRNGSWPCAKHHTALCACAKSRQYWALP